VIMGMVIANLVITQILLGGVPILGILVTTILYLLNLVV